MRVENVDETVGVAHAPLTRKRHRASMNSEVRCLAKILKSYYPEARVVPLACGSLVMEIRVFFNESLHRRARCYIVLHNILMISL